MSNGIEWIINSWKTVAIGAVVVLLIIGGVFLYTKAYGQFKKDCASMNGHVKTRSQTSTTTGYHTVNGKQEYGTYTTTTSTTYCIGNNGGILDVM